MIKRHQRYPEHMEKGKQVKIMMHLKGRMGNFMRMLNLWWEMMSKNIRKAG